MIYERHQILSSWLIQLGVNKQTAGEDACRIEHDISKESFNAIKQAISEQLSSKQK
jgi:Mn-dependent DtxR family transcriptional regulator